jgi:hypothetical protein
VDLLTSAPASSPGEDPLSSSSPSDAATDEEGGLNMEVVAKAVGEAMRVDPAVSHMMNGCRHQRHP